MAPDGASLLCNLAPRASGQALVATTRAARHALVREALERWAAYEAIVVLAPPLEAVEDGRLLARFATDDETQERVWEIVDAKFEAAYEFHGKQMDSMSRPDEFSQAAGD